MSLIEAMRNLKAEIASLEEEIEQKRQLIAERKVTIKNYQGEYERLIKECKHDWGLPILTTFKRKKFWTRECKLCYTNQTTSKTKSIPDFENY
jgi:GTPase involved in cell partitioning and DNA repair